MEGAFIQAVQQVLLSPYVWLVIIASALYGVFMGAVPGLTATMAGALLVPVVYFMEPVPALTALVTLTACAIFAGDIPAALLRIPGTPASAAYMAGARWKGSGTERPQRTRRSRAPGYLLWSSRSPAIPSRPS